MSRKSRYLSLVKSAHDKAMEGYDDAIDKWHKEIDPDHFFGYIAPNTPVYTALVEGFLFSLDGDTTHAENARERLVTYRQFADAYPKDFYLSRAEYLSGLPPLNSMFTVPLYVEAYGYIKDSGVLSEEDRKTIEAIVSDSVKAFFAFPEWGSHNRCALRAWSMMSAAKEFPEAQGVDDWRQMARQMASDSLGRWSIEDAMLYHAIWAHSMIKYADVAGEKKYFREVTTRYYFDYFLNQMTPAKTLIDFGDSHDMRSNAQMYIATFERAAIEYNDPYYAWAANTMFEGMEEVAEDKRCFGTAVQWIDAYNWCNDSIEPEEPHWRSRELLDELVGKKVIFRSGWGPKDTVAMLNFKPDTDYGMTIRDYMHNTISVHAEKDHHGHSDENAICILMHDEALLLHDGGYREKSPNGKYRQDIYHNRTVVRPGFLKTGEKVYPFLDDDGTHRRLETQLVDFHTFDQVEFSRTRAIDRDMGYQIDRTLVYLKPESIFLVIDGLQFLRDGDFTLSTLYYTGEVRAEGDGWFDGWLGKEMNGFTQTNTDTSLLVVYTEANPYSWSGQEKVRRFHRDEIMLHNTLSGRFHLGQWQVMVSVLIPHGSDVDPAELAKTISIPEVSRFPRAAGVQLKTGDGTITIGVKLDRTDEVLVENIRPRHNWESGRTAYGDVETDAKFIWVRDKGPTIDYAWTESTQMDWKGNTVFEASLFGHALQYTGEWSQDHRNSWRAWEQSDVKVG